MTSFEQLTIDANTFVTIDPAAAEVLRAHGFPVELGHVQYEVRSTEALGNIDHQFTPTGSLVVRANASDSSNENIETFGGLVARSRGAVMLRDDLSLSASHTQLLGGG